MRRCSRKRWPSGDQLKLWKKLPGPEGNSTLRSGASGFSRLRQAQLQDRREALRAGAAGFEAQAGQVQRRAGQFLDGAEAAAFQRGQRLPVGRDQPARQRRGVQQLADRRGRLLVGGDRGLRGGGGSGQQRQQGRRDAGSQGQQLAQSHDGTSPENLCRSIRHDNRRTGRRPFPPASVGADRPNVHSGRQGMHGAPAFVGRPAFCIDLTPPNIRPTMRMPELSLPPPRRPAAAAGRRVSGRLARQVGPVPGRRRRPVVPRPPCPGS